MYAAAAAAGVYACTNDTLRESPAHMIIYYSSMAFSFALKSLESSRKIEGIYKKKHAKDNYTALICSRV